jgi:hypothetical protein
MSGAVCCFGDIVGPSPRQHSFAADLDGDVEIDCDSEPLLAQDLRQRVGLSGSARETVEQDTASLDVRLGEALRHDAHHHVVGNEIPTHHDRVGLSTECRTFGHRGPKHVARGDVNGAEMGHQQRALRALARALAAKDDQPDGKHRVGASLRARGLRDDTAVGARHLGAGGVHLTRVHYLRKPS